MKIELNEDQIIKIVQDYYKEIEGNDIMTYLKLKVEDNYESAVIMKYSYIEFDGMSFKTEEELGKDELLEIINHYLPAECNFKGMSFGPYRHFYRPDDYTERTKLTIDLEPVVQKTKGRHL